MEPRSTVSADVLANLADPVNAINTANAINSANPTQQNQPKYKINPSNIAYGVNLTNVVNPAFAVNISEPLLVPSTTPTTTTPTTTTPTTTTPTASLNAVEQIPASREFKARVAAAFFIDTIKPTIDAGVISVLETVAAVAIDKCIPRLVEAGFTSGLNDEDIVEVIHHAKDGVFTGKMVNSLSSMIMEGKPPVNETPRLNPTISRELSSIAQWVPEELKEELGQQLSVEIFWDITTTVEREFFKKTFSILDEATTEAEVEKKAELLQLTVLSNTLEQKDMVKAIYDITVETVNNLDDNTNRLVEILKKPWD